MSWTDHETTKVWLSKQAIWYTGDMWKAFIGGGILGLVIGFIL